MIQLAAADVLAGVAASASAITFSIFGMELAAGVEAYKLLAQGQLASSVGTLYTSPSSTQAFIKSISLVNTTGADVSGVKLFLTGTASGKQITGSLTIPADGWATYEEDGWRVYNSSGACLESISGVSTGGGGGGNGTFPFDVLPQFAGDGFLYGIPGFTPLNTSAYSFPGTQKAIVQPFRIKSETTISELYINVQQARTTVTLRFMIYAATFTNGSMVALGAKLYDSGADTTSGTSTGTKTKASVNTVLQQGNYALVIAQNNGGTGSLLILKTLAGTMEGNEIALPSGGNWRANSELGYTGADVATTPSDPWSGTLVASATTWSVVAGSAVAYPMVVAMRYQFTNPSVTVSGGSAASGTGLIQSWPVTFSTTTTDSDPGPGAFRWNASSLGNKSDLIMYLDLLDSNGVDKTSVIDALALSDSRKVTLVRLYQNATSQEFVVGKVMSWTTATGYRKLGIKLLHLRDVAAANNTNYTIQFESHGAGFPLMTMAKNSVSNDTRITGLPGFTPNKIKSKSLTSARAQCVFFELTSPILLRAITAMITAIPTTGGDRRVLIYNINDQRVDGHYGGSLQYDSGLQTGNWALATGPRTITPSVPVMIPAGQYLLIDAIGVFTGTLTVNALNGAFHHSAGIKLDSSVWSTLTDCYIPSDLTGTPADPLGSLASMVFTEAALPTTAGADQFDLVTAIQWNPAY